MKFCWDNIENIIFTKNGNFFDTVKNRTYHYMESCKQCKNPFLCISGNKNEYCCGSCSKKGKKHTEKTKKLISKNVTGVKSSNWKGGYSKRGIPAYDTYFHQLEWCEEVRRNKEDPNVLEVRCFKCDKWYIPKLNSVNQRIQCLKGNYKGESKFYCSDQCKNSCSIYGKNSDFLMKQDAIRAGRLSWLELGRVMQPELRSMVLERDEHKCVKCGSKENLQCHHILPVSVEPLLSADIDNCITLCYTCHKKIHQEIDGCVYPQLKLEIC